MAGKFTLFAGRLVPRGGWEDMASRHFTLEKAIADGERCMERGCTWFHVVDLMAGEIVFSSGSADGLEEGWDKRQSE